MKKKIGLLLLFLFTVLSVGCASEDSVSVQKETDFDYVEVPVEVEVGTSTDANEEVVFGDNGPGINSDYAGLDDAVVPVQDSRKIVYTASLLFESFDLDESYDLLTKNLSIHQAYIENESITDTRLYLTIRVPSEGLDDLLTSIKEGGKLISYTKESEDITNQYSTYEARKLALETQHQRILELIEVAETTQDLMELEVMRADIESELNEIGLQLTYYDDLVDYSTITVQVNYVDYELYNRLPIAETPRVYYLERGTDFVTFEFENNSDYTMNSVLTLYLNDEEVGSYSVLIYSLTSKELTIDELESNTTYRYTIETTQADHEDAKVIKESFNTYTTYGDDASNTFSNSWESFGDFWVGFSLVLIASIPVLLTLGALGTVIVLLMKKKNLKLWGGIKKGQNKDQE